MMMVILDLFYQRKKIIHSLQYFIMYDHTPPDTDHNTQMCPHVTMEK